jgi:hypothetical protein
MRGRKKITVLLSGLLITGAALFIAFLALVSALFNKETIKQRIAAELSGKLQGEASYQEMELTYWPRPAILVRQSRIIVPGKARVDAVSLKVFPQILPLFSGKVRLAAVEAKSPVVAAALPQREDQGEQAPVNSSDVLRQRLVVFFGYIAAVAPNLQVTIDGAQVSLFENLENMGESGPVLHFQDVVIRAVLPPSAFKLDVTATSNVAKRIHLEISGTTEDLKMRGALEVVDLQVRKALDDFLSTPLPELVDSTISANINFDAENPNMLKAAIEKLVYTPMNKQIPFMLELDGGQVFWAGKQISVEKVNCRFGKSSLSQLSVRIDYGPEAAVQISSGAGRILLDQVYSWLQSMEPLRERLRKLEELKGLLVVDNVKLSGQLSKPAAWDMSINGAVENIQARSDFLPDQLTVSNGAFKVNPEFISLVGWKAELLDAAVLASGTLPDYASGIGKVQANLEGSVGPKAAGWLSGFLHTPADLKTRQAFVVQQANLDWEKGSGVNFSGALKVNNGLGIFLDMQAIGDQLFIKELNVKDNTSDAILSLTRKKELLNVNFRGVLSKSTLDGILEKNTLLGGMIEGDMDARIDLSEPANSAAKGAIHVVDFAPPWKINVPVKIVNASLKAQGDTINIESSRLLWDGKKEMNLEGAVRFSPKGFDFNMALATEGVLWEELKRLWQKDAGKESGERTNGGATLPIQGVLRVQTRYFTLDEYSWRPVVAEVRFEKGKTDVHILEASLCGISTPGTITVTGQTADLHFTGAASGRHVETTLGCIFNKPDLMTGSFDFSGKAYGRGRGEDLLKSMDGEVEFTAHNGRIFRSNILSRILAAINITEIFRGKVPDLVGEGFAYNSIGIEGTIENSRLILKKAVVDGASMKLFADGKVDLVNKTLDLIVVVAPLQTVDAIIGKLPIIGGLLGGKLVSIPVKVTGSISDPKVVPLPPSAVGTGLRGLMERTLKLPFDLIEPILPGRR